MNGRNRWGSDYAVRAALLFSLSLSVAASSFGATLAQEVEQHGDIDVGVVLDTDGESGRANATVRIHAPREVVWSLITDCADALELVPGLVSCDVLETAPDNSWQRIRQVLDYSWYVRKLTYQIRATYDKPVSVSIERVSGDLRTLNVFWNLKSDGDYTVAHYRVDLAPGFWVPQWLVRVALRRDLPKMLRALRTRAELLARR
ncbi:MAG TPA: SRPBCC family protein [Steroidobacteraceae bacterium]|nr:SRPBCC family protein [Steroidobacteraceae bacterium]